MKKGNTLLFFVFFILTLTCTVDHGLAPLPGKLIVTVAFRGTPPDNTEGIYLNVAPEFPPHAINELYHSPNSLPLDQDTVTTELALPYGHYDAVSLWWYNKETESNLADVLALPLDPHNNLEPMGFDLSDTHPVHEMVLYANWNRVKRDASIKGKVYFNGLFPEDTQITAVAAYAKKPEADVQFLIWLKSIDFSVGETSRSWNADELSYSFSLPVTNGYINYLAVFWLKEKAGLTDYITLGIYEDPENPGSPGKLSLAENAVADSIYIYADWSRVNP